MAYTAPTAQFYPSASLRVLDATVYHQIQSDYSLGQGTSDPAGSNIIIGISPLSLGSQYGIPYVNNPTSADYGNLPGVFTTTGTSVVNGTPITPDATQNGVQTLASSYTDPNGQSFTSVTWAWQVEVVLYTVADKDVFSQQFVSWTGDGTSNRLIPTNFDLTVGNTAVWIFSDIGAPTLCTSAMIAAGKHATYSVNPASTTAGVMSMTASGFTITGGFGIDVNTLTGHYVAVVWNDTTGAKMSVGTYTGDWNGVSPKDKPQGIDLGVNGAGVKAGVPVSTVFLTRGSAGTGNPDGIFATTDLPSVASIVQGNISTSQSSPVSGLITSMGVGGFTVGTVNDTNSDGHVFYYVAFAFDSTDVIKTGSFAWWHSVGTGSTLTVSGLPFTPAFALGRINAFPTFQCFWRGPVDVGTASHNTAIGSSVASGGIEGMSGTSLTLGTTLAPNGAVLIGFILAGTPTPVPSITPRTWVDTIPVDPGDGTRHVIDIIYPPTETPPTPTATPTDTTTAQWWCYPKFGWSIHQLTSPGDGWVACSGPATSNGWYLSTAEFGGPDIIVSGGQPADPRAWEKLSTWCAVGNMAVYGGAPSASCETNNRLFYPGSDYTVGSTYPTIHSFDGRADKIIAYLPSTSAGVPKAVMSMLAANSVVYLSTWDSGTSSSDWSGRVMQLDPVSGKLTLLGTAFAAGEMPYALCWHMGRLWCGTNNGIGTVGKVYYFRPGIDTSWTQDYSLATSSAGGVTSMASYKGFLYVGTDNAAASRGKVLARDTSGAYTTSRTGSGGTAKVNNGYLALTVLGGNLYASYWNNDTTPISKIEKFDGSSWSTAYTGVSSTLVPFILLHYDNNELYAVGGSKPYQATLLVTADGTTWTNLTAQLPVETVTFLPMFGGVVL